MVVTCAIPSAWSPLLAHRPPSVPPGTHAATRPSPLPRVSGGPGPAVSPSCGTRPEHRTAFPQCLPQPPCGTSCGRVGETGSAAPGHRPHRVTQILDTHRRSGGQGGRPDSHSSNAAWDSANEQEGSGRRQGAPPGTLRWPGLGCEPPEARALGGRALPLPPGPSPCFRLFFSLCKLGTGERCPSVSGHSGEKRRWPTGSPSSRQQGSRRPLPWHTGSPDGEHGRQAPAGATSGDFVTRRRPDRRPRLPGQGMAAHGTPPGLGTRRTDTPHNVSFTCPRKSPWSSVCQKLGDGGVASEEGDIFSGRERKCPPKPCTAWCELFLRHGRNGGSGEKDRLPGTRPAPRSPAARLVSVTLGPVQHPGGQAAATTSQLRPRGDAGTAVVLKPPG